MAHDRPRKKLIEVALPLDAIDKAEEQKWKERLLATAAKEEFAGAGTVAEPVPTLAEVAAEREWDRLFALIEELVQWENTPNEKVLRRRATRSGRAGAARARRTQETRASKTG